MKYGIFLVVFGLAIGFSIFVNVPSNLNYKIFVSPPATSIKKITLNKDLLSITINSTTVKIKYLNIDSLIDFLNQRYPVVKKKALLKIESLKKINFMGKIFETGQFLIDSGWYYCTYNNFLYIFEVKDNAKIEIEIPKYTLKIFSKVKADIFLSNKIIGETPLSTKLCMDKYTLFLKPIKGYKPQTKTIFLNSDKKIDVNFERLNKVSIKTNVRDFKVYINGDKKEKEFYLEKGKYLLTIEATGFYKLNTTITVNKNKENLYFNLKPKVFVLNINTLDKAKIYVDNVFIGYKNISVSLPCGEHKIIVSLKGYKTISKVIDLEKNENINLPLSPKSGTIVQSFNVENSKFASYDSNGLIILTDKNIFKISNSVSILTNEGYSYVCDKLFVSISGKIKIGSKEFFVKPFITSVIKFENIYVISTSSGDIYKFNGINRPVLMKSLSLNFSYIKILPWNKNILALASNGKIYQIDLKASTRKVLIDKKFIKDFDVYKDRIYILTDKDMEIYKDDRKISEISGEYDYVYNGIAYGENILNIEKNTVMGKYQLKAINSTIYYYNGFIYYPDKNRKYSVDSIPIKMIKYDEYLVIIEKNKVEVMKL